MIETLSLPPLEREPSLIEITEVPISGSGPCTSLRCHESSVQCSRRSGRRSALRCNPPVRTLHTGTSYRVIDSKIRTTPLKRVFDRADGYMQLEQFMGKVSHFPCTIAESTLRTLMDYGLRGTLPSRPVRAPSIRFLSIDSHVCLMLPSDPASRQ